MGKSVMTKRDNPWIIRTYSGHSSAKESNTLYKANLAKGQTGLSIAFDLPTQTGYDSDHILSKGEVGKVGVPICHLGDIRTLFEGIPLSRMNTSMTINATAPWLLALYIALAKEQNTDPGVLRGTVQNDLVKEYLSRGTFIFPPEESLKLMGDVATYCFENIPKWNPMNVCSYHLQEAGATPVQELAYALATAIAVLDEIQPQVSPEDFPQIVGRISFFLNAGIKFITETCKIRAFVELWDDICLNRYKVEEQKFRRFRYGVQVNSLGLTEQQPENNVYRILLELLAVTLSKNARARAVQLPAWNEALGLPRPWDQQWSLRMQQILAYETDLLEFEDLFDGNPEIEKKVEEIKTKALAELKQIMTMGGAIKSIEHMKRRLVESNAERVRKIESGETTLVGVNKFVESEPSPLIAGDDVFLTPKETAEDVQISSLIEWRNSRDNRAVSKALNDLASSARVGENIMPVSIKAAEAGVTTGEWAQTLREIYGNYRGPLGISSKPSNRTEGLDELRSEVDRVSAELGTRIKILIGKPGLDGHSNGAEQIAFRARDIGMKIVYTGIRYTVDEIVETALKEEVHLIGLSILSGSHLSLVEEVIDKLNDKGGGNIPIILGGIIPDEDQAKLTKLGLAAIYTPKDYELNSIMQDIIEIIRLQVGKRIPTY